MSAATEAEPGNLTRNRSRGVEAIDDCSEDVSRKSGSDSHERDTGLQPDERLDGLVAALNRFAFEDREAIRDHCVKMGQLCDRARTLIRRLKRERRLMPAAKPGQSPQLPGGRVYAPELAQLVKHAVSTDAKYLKLYPNASEPPAIGTFLVILKRYEKHGLVAFVRRAQTISQHRDKRFLEVPQIAEDWLRANYRSYATARLTKFGEKWLEWAKRHRVELPFTTHRPGDKGSCYWWLHRWRQQIPAPAVTLATKGERGFEATYGYIIRDYSDLRPRDGWTMDWRQFDVCYWVTARRGGGEAKLVRDWLCPVIDLASVACFGWVIEDRPSARGVRRAYLDAVRQSEWKQRIGDNTLTGRNAAMELLCGMQRKRAGGEEPFVHFDNGKDFRAKLIEGTLIAVTSLASSRFDLDSSLVSTLRSYDVSVAAEVGIRIRHAKVRNAKSKIVEPWFRYAIGLWEETIPGFCGNKITAKPHWFAAAQRIHQAFMKRRAPKSEDLKELPPLWLETYERNKETYGVGTPFLSEAEFKEAFTQQLIKYLNEPHGRLSDDLGKMSPLEYLRQTADAPHLLTETTITSLLMDTRVVTVVRAEIPVQWNREEFVYREVKSELSDGAALSRLPGEKPKVEFKYEATNVGRAKVMFEGKPLCWVEEPRLLGWNATADDFKAAKEFKKRQRDAAEEFLQPPKGWQDIAADRQQRQEPQVIELQKAVGAEDLLGIEEEPAPPPRADIIFPTRFDRKGPRLVTTESTEPEGWERSSPEPQPTPDAPHDDDFEDLLKTF